MIIKDLKVGMMVFIREDLEVGVKYGNDIFIDSMKDLTGLQKVTRVGDKIIEVDDEGWHFTSEMIDWNKTEKLNNKYSMLFYDGTTLKGQIDGQDIEVIRKSEDEEDLEKAVMMGILKSLGYSFSDVKRLQNKIKTVWEPKYSELYYYVGSYGVVESTWNSNHDSDKNRFAICNYFKTKEEAEQKAIKFRELFKEQTDINNEQ